MRENTITKILLSLVCIIGASLTSFAQQKSDTRLVSGYVNLNDSANIYQALYNNSPIEPEFKLVPKFAIVGAENKFVFSLGASMKFTSSFDWGNPVRNPMGIGVSDLHTPLTSDRRLFQMAAGGSGIFFNIIGFPNTANEIGLFISVGLDSESNNTYRLSAGQVYMRYRDFQCGYATSLYNDRKADAYTIDAHGPCASGAHNTVGMNWQHYVNDHIRIGLGIELPKASYTQIDPDDASTEASKVIYMLTSNQSMPNFPLYIGYAWKTGHIRLSSIFRNIHYIDLTTGQSHNVFGNGIKLTGNAMAGPVNFFWMGQIGWASASTFLDDSDAGLDLVPNDSAIGLLRPIHCWGCIVAAQWNITSRLFTTAQYSYMRNYIPYYTTPATIGFGDQMHYGYTVTANAVWKFSSLFSTGIEYRYAHKYKESTEGLGNSRIYAMLLMNF